MNITFIRHAEAETNIKRELIGWYQPLAQLTQLWENQARALWNRLLADQFFDSFDWNIYCSPAVRTRETARIVFDLLGLDTTTIQIDDRLRELWQWDWENKRRSDIYTSELKVVLQQSNGQYRPPNGESQIDVADRMEDWLTSINPEKNYLVFSHGMAIKCLIQRLIWFPAGTAHIHELSNTGITELQKWGFGWSLTRYNDHAHLSKNK